MAISYKIAMKSLLIKMELELLLWGKKGKPENQTEIPRGKYKNQLQTQPNYMYNNESRKRTKVTLVERKRCNFFFLFIFFLLSIYCHIIATILAILMLLTVLKLLTKQNYQFTALCITYYSFTSENTEFVRM